MPQVKFDTDNTVKTPKKILDVGPRGAFIGLQVLDASTLFFDTQRDTLEVSGIGAAAPNLVMGFQLKSAQGIFTTWWKGELWGISDTNGGLINAQVLYQVKGKCGCGGESDDRPPALTDEL